MNEKTLKVLEYGKIKSMLKEQAVSSMAKKIADDLSPYLDTTVVEEELRSTSEGVDLIVNKGPLPIYSLYDINGTVDLARKGAVLSMKQLIQIGYNLKTCSKVKGFLKGDLPPVPKLKAMGDVLISLEKLSAEIDRCIISEEEMADDATAELARIRREILRTGDNIKVRLNKMIGSSENKTVLREAIVTVRDGRYVIPVKAEQAYKVPGLVHDRSKGGQTLFIEPQVIVNMNNDLRQLQLSEESEIARILKVFSEEVGNEWQIILNNQKLLVQMDFIMAKAKLSLSMDGVEPVITNKKEISIIRGRHPLLDSKKVVPTTVSIGDNYNTLIITGPNTGGKTVALKTVGLFALMVQSGLHIPADDNTMFYVFNSIYADIGDEQSIEQSLSTFSSHMKNIVDIVEAADESSLILLDELGAGTDPTEGAALAISIMERLKALGGIILATTHYNEIKKYALATPGVENASMEFDIDTLSPTYRLIVGIPGKSKAFEISRKLGLSSEVIERAEEMIHSEDIKFEDLLGSLERNRQQAEQERDEAIMINIAMKKKESQVKRQLEELEKRKDKIIKEAKEEARSILEEARRVSKEVQKELRQLDKSQSLGERNKIFAEGRRRIGEAEKAMRTPLVRKINAEPVSADVLKHGMRVKILTLNQNGIVAELPDDKGNLIVKVGGLRVKSKLSDIAIIVDGNKSQVSNTHSVRRSNNFSGMHVNKAMNITPRIDVRGESLDDAMIDVEKHIDDAYMAGLSETIIIHGRGEGILREGIRRELRRNKHVSAIEKPNYNEGGEGATIVKLRKG